MTKTVALIVLGHLNLAQVVKDSQWHLDRASAGLDWLMREQIPGFEGACWGYSHDWQSRSMFLPKHQPSLVCSVFVSRAFLAAYERFADERYLAIARSSCNFILQDLPRLYSGKTYCFSYVPFDQVFVHNANLLGVELLGRIYAHLGEQALLENALPALQFTLQRQSPNGAWYYDVHNDKGLSRSWIDNFHTGFMIESLLHFAHDTGYELQNHVCKGLRYYVAHFFSPEGQPRRSSAANYPVDLRDCAQAIIVGSMLEPADEANEKLQRVLGWTLQYMSIRSGLYTYQKWPFVANPVIYLRFQAWMLYSLSCVLVKRLQNPRRQLQ